MLAQTLLTTQKYEYRHFIYELKTPPQYPDYDNIRIPLPNTKKHEHACLWIKWNRGIDINVLVSQSYMSDQNT